MELKKNQLEFALDLGLSRSHISNIENGRENVSTSVIKLISKTYNINEDWIISGEGELFNNALNWDELNNDNMQSKYFIMKEMLEKYIFQLENDDLTRAINIYSAMVSLITMKKTEKTEYLTIIEHMISNLEKYTFYCSMIPNTMGKGSKINKSDCIDLMQHKTKLDTTLSFDADKIMQQCINNEEK